MSAITDAELIQAWRTGDRASGEELFDRYYGAVARFFLNKTDESSCAELTQRTFLACLEGLERLASASNFRSYLFAIAYRLLCQHYGRINHERKKVDLLTATAQELSPTPTQALAMRQEQRLLLAGLRSVPVEYQVVLEMFYWEQMTATEIAEALELPLGTAKTRLRRGRQLLEVALTDLADSKVLLQSTVTGLEQWAAAVRGQVALPRPGGPC